MFQRKYFIYLKNTHLISRCLEFLGTNSFAAMSVMFDRRQVVYAITSQRHLNHFEIRVLV